jgi:hypothetical protein
MKNNQKINFGLDSKDLDEANFDEGNTGESIMDLTTTLQKSPPIDLTLLSGAAVKDLLSNKRSRKVSFNTTIAIPGDTNSTDTNDRRPIIDGGTEKSKEFNDIPAKQKNVFKSLKSKITSFLRPGSAA